jgi:hypothetical protein
MTTTPHHIVYDRVGHVAAVWTDITTAKRREEELLASIPTRKLICRSFPSRETAASYLDRTKCEIVYWESDEPKKQEMKK